MKKQVMIIAILGALAASEGVFAQDVMITGGTGLTLPSNGENAYFGLKGREDLFARLHERVMEYWTPDLNGFDAGVSYVSDDMSKFGIVPANDDRYSLSMSYTYGKVSAFLENERSLGYGSAGLARSGTDLGAMYRFAPGTRFGLGFEQRGYDFAAGAARSMEARDWYVSLVQDVGKTGHLRVSFAQSAQSEYLPSGDKLSLGYGQLLSKQTEVYALYSRSRNPDSFSLGSSPNEFGLGLKYNF